MAGKQPLYIMIKPPVPVAHAIDCLRPALGIDRRYGWERLHTTLLPLCDGRAIPGGFLNLLDEAILSLEAEPFGIAFDRLDRNALVGGQSMRAPRALQRRLALQLTRRGLTLPTYRFNPHLSLAYGEAPERKIPIPPVAWLAEELLLIRSIHGEGRHELLGRWPLVLRQKSFAFP